MGWTFLHKTPGETSKAFFSREFNSYNDNYTHELQDCRTVGNTVYCAMRVTPKPGKAMSMDDIYHTGHDGSIVYGLVVQINRRPRDHYNFGYKAIDETMGPCESCCPKSILAQLSPIRGDALGDSAEWASEWRERCHKYAERKAA